MTTSIRAIAERLRSGETAADVAASLRTSKHRLGDRLNRAGYNLDGHPTPPYWQQRGERRGCVRCGITRTVKNKRDSGLCADCRIYVDHTGEWEQWGVQPWRTPPHQEKPRRQSECGTLSGYRRHRTLREPACRACMDARNADRRERRRKGRVDG